MVNPISGFQLAQQGVSLSPSSAAPTPATPTPPTRSQSSVSSGTRIYRYPLENMLEGYTDYVKISSYRYIPPGVGELSPENFSIPTSDTNYQTLNKKDLQGTVLLPMPQSLPGNSQSAKWGEGRLNSLTGSAIGAASKTLESQNPISGGVSAITSYFKSLGKAVQTGIGQDAVQTYFATKAIEQLTQQQDLFGEILARETGAVINENVELLFRGVNLREGFTLDFDLAPRDDKEAQEIRNMVLFLKKEMSPNKGSKAEAAGGLFLTAPNVFKIEYMSGTKNHPYLNRFKICAMSGLSLNFTPDNTYATYSDGTPVHMQLSLSFQELTPIYAEDYQTTEGTSGVGY